MILHNGHDIKTWSYTPHLILFITAPKLYQMSVNCQMLSVYCWSILQDMISRMLITGADHQWNYRTSYFHYSLHSQLLFKNNNSFSNLSSLQSCNYSDIFQSCVLLELTYLLTRHIVCLVKVIPLAQRVQVPAHLVRLEQWQMRRRLNVVILNSFKISTTYFIKHFTLILSQIKV